MNILIDVKLLCLKLVFLCFDKYFIFRLQGDEFVLKGIGRVEADLYLIFICLMEPIIIVLINALDLQNDKVLFAIIQIL